MFIAMFIRFVTTSLVCENKDNGDKLHHRKSMRAADDKLIINELGPYEGPTVKRGIDHGIDSIRGLTGSESML